MISFSSVGSSAGAAKYFDDSLSVDGNISKGADNYYLDGAETPMTWHGKAAEVLGLDGKVVERQQFLDLLDGKMTDPATGEMTDLSQNSKERRAGFDLTVSAPKSVSIAGLVGGDSRVIEAHEAAVQAAMQYIESGAGQFRSRQGGAVTITGSQNMIWGSARHSTNRLNEPDIHTHNVVPAVTWDEAGGRWRSLANDEVMNIRKSADRVYKAELAQGLIKAGYELEWGKDGNFEVKGAMEFNAAYSLRSQAIKAHLESRGIDPSKATTVERQAATLATRPEKGEITEREAHAKWLEVAQEHGFDSQKLKAGAVLRSASIETKNREAGKSGANQMLAAHTQAAKAVAAAVEHLSSSSSVFKSSALAVEALRLGQRGAFGMKEVNDVIAQFKNDGALVSRSAGKGVDGFTTEAAINREKTIERLISAGKGQGQPVLNTEAEFNAALKKYEDRMGKASGIQEWRLSDGQRQAAKNALMHSDRVQVIQGIAGTGKTAAVAFVREVMESRGSEIVGIAPTGKAAAALAQETGIAAKTVAGFVKDIDRIPEMLRKDIAALEKKYSGFRSGKEKTYLDSHLRTLGAGLAKDKYVIDHKTGDVYRANAGITNLKNTAAIAALDSAKKGDAQGKRDWEKAVARDNYDVAHGPETSDGKLAKAAISTGVVRLGNKLIGNVAKDSIEWKKVGGLTASAVKARAAWSDRTIDAEIATKKEQLKNVLETGSVEGKKVTLVVDEFSLVDTKDAARLMAVCAERNITMIAQGDKSQISGVGAGAGTLFGRMQEMVGDACSHLTEGMRFKSGNAALKESQRLWHGGKDAAGEKDSSVKPDHTAAVKTLMQPEVKSSELAKKVADRYMEKSAEYKAEHEKAKGSASLKTVGVVTTTNADRNSINKEIHDLRVQAGELTGKEFTKKHDGQVHLTEAERKNASALEGKGIDRFEVVQNSDELGVKKGDRLSVISFDHESNAVTLARDDGSKVNVALKSEEAQCLNPAKSEERTFAEGEKVTARANIGDRFEKEIDPQGREVSKRDEAGNEIANPNLVRNGEIGVIEKIDEHGATIRWGQGEQAITTQLSNDDLSKVDYGYAQTAFKEQGQTHNWELGVVGQNGVSSFNDQTANVMITRAKEGCEIYTCDSAGALKAIANTEEKSMATDFGQAAPSHDSSRAEKKAEVESGKDLFKGTATASKIEKVTKPEVEGDDRALHKAAASRYVGARNARQPEHERPGRTGQVEPASGSVEAEIKSIAKDNLSAANAAWSEIKATAEQAKAEKPAQVDGQQAEKPVQVERAQAEKPVRVGLITLTEADRVSLNEAVREERKAAGEIGRQDFVKEHTDTPSLSKSERADVSKLQAADVDSFEAEKGDRSLGVKAGDTLKISSFDAEKNEVTVQTPEGKEKKFDPSEKDGLRPTRETVRSYSEGDEVVAQQPIGDKTVKDEDGRTVPNEDRIEKGSQGEIKEIDRNGASIEWQTGRGPVTTYMTNEQLKHVDLDYAHCPSKNSNGPGQATDRDIVVVSERGLGEFQKEAVGFTKGSSEKEIMTNCRDEMLSAVGKEEPKRGKEDRQVDRERTQDRSEGKGAEQEKAPKRQDKQRELSM